MRDGLALSLFGHVALLAWGLLSLPSPKPLDASQIETIPVNFVSIADVTSVPKGAETPKPVERPQPDPIATAIAEQTPPLPEPEPPPPPAPKPPEPAPVAPPPPTPPEPTPPEPEPTPPPEETPPEKTAPEPEPEPAPAPEPAPTPEPLPPETPPPAPEPVPDKTEIQPKPDSVPQPKPRPKMVAQAPQAPQPEKKPDTFNPDQIAALLDKDKTAPEPQQEEPSLGGTTASIDAQMTVNELDALRARLAQCWSPPIGWTEAAEVRVVLILALNADGSVNGEPQVLERPPGRYEQAAPESALRAVRRCAPYTLPPNKYESWKEVRITFDPTEMSGG